jgi:hypothetical protein
MEGSPGNTNFRSRYAFSLTGLSNVAAQVGLVDLAEEKMVQARDILGQLSLSDPGNVDDRFEYLVREYWAAELLAEKGSLEEAIWRVRGVDEAMLEVLEAESFSNQRRYARWVGYLLARADLSRRSGDAEAANADLDEAVGHLHRLLQADPGGTSITTLLHDARFLSWQQHGNDLFTDKRFATVGKAMDGTERTCASRANQMREAILTGQLEQAGQIAASLLSKGYYEPTFVRDCSQYDLCNGG